MTNPVPPKTPSDADLVRTTDATTNATTSRATTTTRTTTNPRASDTAAPAPDDAIVRAADGDSDYQHSDMAEAVDEAQHKVGHDTVRRDTIKRP